MSIAGFVKVVCRLPKVTLNHGLKRGLWEYGVKQSIKQVGVVPACTGLLSAPIGAVLCPIPGTAEATALVTAAVTRGIIKAPSIFMKTIKACPTSCKNITIGSLK